MLQGIAGEQILLALGEQVGQRQVDRSDRAVKVQRAKQFGSHANEPDQGRQPARMNSQPRFAEKTVMQQPFQIKSPCVIARHVRVAKDKVHVIDRVEPAEQASQKSQPARRIGPLDREVPARSGSRETFGRFS